MALTTSILTDIASNLAADLLLQGASRLRDLAFGDPATRAFRQAWEAAFSSLLTRVEADGGAATDAALLETLLRSYVRTPGVAESLLNLALEGCDPSLENLRVPFAALENGSGFRIDFDTALAALVRGLSDDLLAQARQPGSPLTSVVSLGRVLALGALLEDQGRTLDEIAATLRRLDSRGGTVYNTFVQHAQGPAIGDHAQAGILPDLRPLMDEILARLDRMLAPPPYTQADLAAYLTALIEACSLIHLPYPSAKGATQPLDRIYVGLKADRSAPAERKASRELLDDLAREQAELEALPEAPALARAALLNPYAASHWIYSPERRAELRRAAEELGERTHHLAEIVRRCRWMVLLGDPGSGKSTLARWLALYLAKATQEDAAEATVPADQVDPQGKPEAYESLGQARLPVLVRISEYAAARWPQPGHDTGLRLESYLSAHLNGPDGELEEARAAGYRALISAYLEVGRATLILDGLDEVMERDQREKTAAEVERLIRTWCLDDSGHCPLDPGCHGTLMAEAAGWRGNQVLVTSRIVGYFACQLHEALPHFVIQPMDDAAVRRFCVNWTSAYAIPDQAEALTQAVLKHDNPNVREQMGRNPLLLTILARVYLDAPEAGLPSRRAELYHRAARVVFEQRQNEWRRLQTTLGNRDLVPALFRITAGVAFQLHGNVKYPAALVDTYHLRAWLRASVREEPALLAARGEDGAVDDLLDAASRLSGFFVAQGQGAFGFLHRQYQEYFAARHLVSQILSCGLNPGPLLVRLGDPNWHEVLLLAVGILAAAAGGSLREEGVVAPPGAAEKVLTAVLDADDPTGGLLPYSLLIAADALNEMPQPAVALVRRIAIGLIFASRRDRPALYTVMARRLRKAFAALPRSVHGNDPVGATLCAILRDHKQDRFARIATVEMIKQLHWYSPPVAKALAETWFKHTEPVGVTLVTLQEHLEQCPEHFALLDLPFRKQVRREPQLWNKVVTHGHWRVLVRALYLAPWSQLSPEAIVRDSVLTSGLLEVLATAPDSQNSLVEWLWNQWEEQEGTAQRDAGIALAYLGDTRIATWLAVSDQCTMQRAVAAAAYVALELASPFRLLSRGKRGYLCDVDIATTAALDGYLDLARPRVHALVHGLDVIIANAKCVGLGKARVAELIVFLRRALDFASKYQLPEPQVSSLAEAHDLAANLQICLDAENAVSFWDDVTRAVTQTPESLITWMDSSRPPVGDRELLGLDRMLAGWRDTVVLQHLLLRLDGTYLADLDEDHAAPVREVLFRWLLGAEQYIVRDYISRHAALLLAEMGTITAETVPLLSICLADPQDLTRYRAQVALNRQFEASALGRETLEQIACYADGLLNTTNPKGKHEIDLLTAPEHVLLPRVCMGEVLENLQHDRPDWLQEWSVAGNASIVRRIRKLTVTSWPAFIDILSTGDLVVRSAALKSASWLARLGRVPKRYGAAFTDALLAQLEHRSGAVRCLAMEALGQRRAGLHPIVERLLSMSLDSRSKEAQELQALQCAWYTALARLAAKTKKHAELHAPILSRLQAALPTPAGAAAWVRFRVFSAPYNSRSMLVSLVDELGGPTAVLEALLWAGINDDDWSGYHEHLVLLVKELLQSEDGENILELLLSVACRMLLEASWQERRMALAVVAAAAQVMPESLCSMLYHLGLDEPQRWLLEARYDISSANSRCFALTALADLHAASPPVLTAVLDAVEDVALVQDCAFRSAHRFRSLPRGFSTDDVLAPLVEALEGTSDARGHLATQLLVALGSGSAITQVPTLHARVVEIIGETLQGPKAEREVYLLSGYRSSIESKGKLSASLLEALVQVWGLPLD